MKKYISLLLVFVMMLSLAASCSVAEETSASEVTTETTVDRSQTAYVVYEAVFLDADEMVSTFNSVRGDAPYDKIPENYHVTLYYRPEEDGGQFYGSEVQVHIIGYKAGEVIDDDGTVAQCEGFVVELHSDDEAVDRYLQSSDKFFHITGSYDYKPKYTEFLDFSDAMPLDITVTGIIGGYLNGDTVTFDAGDIGQPLPLEIEAAA